MEIAAEQAGDRPLTPLTELDALVLVHSPLVGPSMWDAVAQEMGEAGHDIQVADMSGALADGPPYWSRQVEAIADCAAGRRVVLVGHSGAGPLLAAAGGVVDRVDGYVFVDAGLPHPGRSWTETAPPALVAQLRAMAEDGWLPPWAEWWGPDGLKELVPDVGVRERFAAGCPRLPLAMFEEVQPPAPGWPDAPCGYLRLSEGYQDAAAEARALGWPVTEVPTDHLAVLTDPPLVARAVLGLLRHLQP